MWARAGQSCCWGSRGSSSVAMGDQRCSGVCVCGSLQACPDFTGAAELLGYLQARVLVPGSARHGRGLGVPGLR